MTPTETSFPRRPTADPSTPHRTPVASPVSNLDPLAPALEALDRRRPEETVALARTRLQADPADAFAYAILGVGFCQMGQMEIALQALERAHYLNPHDARILYNYGLVLEAAGRPAAAKIRFFAALKLSPQYARARERIADSLPAPAGAAPTEDRPPSAGPLLERLRENEFHSSWLDGPLPKPALEPMRAPEVASNALPPIPAFQAIDAVDSGEASSQPEHSAHTADAESVAFPSSDTISAGSTERKERRGSSRRVIVPVLAFGLLAGAVIGKTFWPSSSPSKAAASAGFPQAINPSPGPERGMPKELAGPGGPSYRQAQLVGADLRDQSLAKADFEDADLSRAQLIRADLRGASFAHATLPGADLRNVSLVQANLLGAQLRDSDLRGADLRGAYLKSAELSNANLSTAWLEGATLTYAGLRQAILTRTQLPKAKLRSAVLNRANLEGANLEGADLQDADLTGADLRGANLASARLNGARYDRDTRWPTGLQAEARGAKLTLLPAR